MLEFVVMPITYKCNCNCIMCSIPEMHIKDLPISFYYQIFNDKNLNCIRSINITGGEPFLRCDLDEIIGIVIDKCKSIKEVIINTNGTIKESIAKVESLLNRYCYCNFVISVSLDAVGERADKVRGLRDVHLKQMDTIKQIKRLEKKYNNLKTVASMTITKVNYKDIIPVFEWVKMHDIQIDYIYATVNTAYINSAKKRELFILNDEENKKVVQDLTLIYKEDLIVSDRTYYEKLFRKILYNEKFKNFCMNREKRGVLIEADGSVRVCGMDDRFYLGNLLEEKFTDIFSRNIPNVHVICESCFTNSYNAYTKEAQLSLTKQLLQEVRKRRMKIHQNIAN